ncbi:MBL fold metallo-hydrolase [Alishewanella sp. 16-MA]|uniref:MBL fold metallo-hydrolase n=1 Tax=Alishewanella maricola TaxID=2795740 RepID=A0ABS8C2T1_9ALTE|nr:MBL fold metallo-hydrolase [Alishewanella maricola]MCB5226652.1 MBL fold metallo-hydrolase [Alishewanella maricola]
MGYEVDFLGVGSESKSGDAIAIRFGNLHGSRHEQTVVVIDGGYSDTGNELVDHIRNHFGTDIVDLVISSHPDQDHINGLEVILNELQVNELWLHQPWLHNHKLADEFADGRLTDSGLGERLKQNLERAWLLSKLANRKGIVLKEPFTGLTDKSGAVKVLGPSQSYYESLIPDFEGMPARAENRSLISEGWFDKAMRVVKTFFANWGEDHIADDGQTSAKNNSSVITQLIVDGRRLVFTADAGIQALEYAADEVDGCYSGAELTLIQIPHHGSRRNVGPTVLNRLIGSPVAQGVQSGVTAIASTARASEPKHPRKAVLNAFAHRGARVLVTRGQGIMHYHNSPGRAGWSSLTAEPYHFSYEEEV